MNQIRADRLNDKIVKHYLKQSGGITYMETRVIKPPKLTLGQLFHLKKGKKKSK